MDKLNAQEVMLKGIAYGLPYSIDFKTRSAKVGSNYVIKNGISKYEIPKFEGTTDEFIAELERLYEQFMYSIPSERSENKRRKYFKGKEIDEISLEKLGLGVDRETASFLVEMSILCQTIHGFNWQTDVEGKFYWYSRHFRDFVIMKDWF